MEVNKHRMLSTTLVSVKKQFIKTVPDFAIVIHFNLNKKKLLQNLFISTKIELKYATYISEEYIYVEFSLWICMTVRLNLLNLYVHCYSVNIE